MKKPDLIDTMRLPCAAFGKEPTRQVRVVASPQTTGETRMTFVSCMLPPGAVSEGHVHDGFDEYIQFQIGGACEIDGVSYNVPAQGVIHAKAGQKHECRNTSKTETLYLSCVFLPPLVPYAQYPELMEKTREHFEKST